MEKELRKIIKDFGVDYALEEYELSEKFIEDNQDLFDDWDLLFSTQNLSTNFIKKYHQKFDWHMISKTENLSDEFIREFQDHLVWSVLCGRQKLSNDMIREFKDKICWITLPLSGPIDETILKEMKDIVNWTTIQYVQKLNDPDLIKEINENGKINNWLFYDENKKRSIVEKTCKILKDGDGREYIQTYKFVEPYTNLVKDKTYYTACCYDISNKNCFGFVTYTDKIRATIEGYVRHGACRVAQVNIPLDSLCVVEYNESYRIIRSNEFKFVDYVTHQ